MGLGVYVPMLWVHEDAIGACVTLLWHLHSTTQHVIAQRSPAQHRTAQHRNMMCRASSSSHDELYNTVGYHD